MRDYREKEVSGLFFPRDTLIIPTPVTIRTTSDKHGQSLSLCACGMMIQIPLENVKDIITLTPKKGGTPIE